MNIHKVHKYQVPFEGGTISMPKGAEVIHVHEQDGGLFVWALACENNAMVSRLFNVYGAGHPLRAPLGKYRGTAHLLQGKLVLHVFDMGEEIDG